MRPNGPQIKFTPAKPTVGSPPVALAFAALIVANIALAFGPWFVRATDVGPVAAGFWRITLATPILAGLAVAGGARPTRLTGGVWASVILAGIAFAADLGAWHLGILRTTLANATLFGNCATLIFPIYGFLAMREWPSRAQTIALLLAAAGGGLLIGRSYSLAPAQMAGDLLCLLAGLLYTLYFVLMARARSTLAPLSALALSSAASIIPLFAFAAFLGERMIPGDWTVLIGLALLSQVLGQGLMIYALGKLPPLVIGIALLIQPIVAGIVGWTVYDEQLGAADLIGAAMVAVALVLVRQRAPVAQAPANPHVLAEEP